MMTETEQIRERYDKIEKMHRRATIGTGRVEHMA